MSTEPPVHNGAPSLGPAHTDVMVPGAPVDEKPDQQETLRNELTELIRLLKKQHSDEAGTAWYERTYGRFKQIVKYVGMPGVLIAAVIPVYNISAALRDYQVKLFVRSQYSAYANTLLEAGELDRASKMMSEIDAADKFEASAQYAAAKLLTRIAIN